MYRFATVFLPWVWFSSASRSIVLSPLLGLVLGFVLMTLVFWTFRHFTPTRVDTLFRRGQLVSAALYSLGHGGNDAQKTMGVIAVLLYANGMLGPDFYVPLWVVLRHDWTLISR